MYVCSLLGKQLVNCCNKHNPIPTTLKLHCVWSFIIVKASSLLLELRLCSRMNRFYPYWQQSTGVISWNWNTKRCYVYITKLRCDIVYFTKMKATKSCSPDYSMLSQVFRASSTHQQKFDLAALISFWGLSKHWFPYLSRWLRRQ